MKIAVLDRRFSPALTAPVSYNHWMQINQTFDGCLKARQIHWLHSVISITGDRSLCLVEVPYVETVREACRQARMPFQQVWQAELWLALDPTSFPQSCSLIIAEVNYDPPMTKAIYEASKDQAEGCLHELNLQHAFSAMSLDGTHSLCGFSAPSAEQVRSLYRKVGRPFESIWPGTLLQPLSENMRN